MLSYTPKGRIKAFSVFVLQGMWSCVLKYEIYTLNHHVMVFKVLWRNVLPIKPGIPKRTPSLFNKCTIGSFMCITQHMGPTALCPIGSTKHHG